MVSEHDAAIKRTAEEGKAEKEAMRRTYDKQLETLREQYETGQVGSTRRGRWAVRDGAGGCCTSIWAGPSYVTPLYTSN